LNNNTSELHRPLFCGYAFSINSLAPFGSFGRIREIGSEWKIRILLCLAFALTPVRAQTVYVSPDHWVYDYLDRLETRGILPVVLAGTRPITRAEIGRCLSEASQREDDLSRVERDQLRYLCYEFMENVEPSCPAAGDPRLTGLRRCSWIDPWLPDLVYANGRDFLSVSSGALRAHLDPVFLRARSWAESDTLEGRERVFEDGNGLRIWGQFGRRLGFYTEVRDTREWGSRDYPGLSNFTREGLGFVRGTGDGLYHDETIAYVTGDWDVLRLQFGRDENQWGPGRHGQLALSDRPTGYDLLKLELGSVRFKYTAMVAFLRHYSDEYYSGGEARKSLAAHRLEFAPVPELDIGLHEIVIYSGRDIEPAYLNPVMFYRSAEHYLGDRDNAALGLDLEFKGIPRTKLYGELFIDDLSTKKLGRGFYGNKLAYLAGLYHVNVGGISELDARIEFARVRPFTYTHKQERNGYRHFATGLGHWIGPNADNLFAELAYRRSRRLLFKLQGERIRHGANPPDLNIGGDLFQPRDFRTDPETVRLLDGDLETVTSLGARISYEVLRGAVIELNVTKFWYYLERQPALKGGRMQVALRLSLNY